MRTVIAAAAATFFFAATAHAAEVGGFGWEAQMAGALDSRVETLSDHEITGIVGGGFGAAPEYIGSARDIQGQILRIIFSCMTFVISISYWNQAFL